MRYSSKIINGIQGSGAKSIIRPVMVDSCHDIVQNYYYTFMRFKTDYSSGSLIYYKFSIYIKNYKQLSKYNCKVKYIFQYQPNKHKQ